MKRFLFGFLAVLFLILNTIPYLHILANQSMSNSQIKQIGAFALSSLITTGEATELDFSDYTDSDTDFLLALGELVVTGDPTSLIDCGLDWLGGEIDDAYDSAIQSIREWEYNISPTLYYWFVDTQPPYELSPTYNNIRDLSQPLRRLLTPPDDAPQPSYPSDYDVFVRNISGFTIDSIDILSAPLLYNTYHWDNRTNYSYYKTSNFNNGFLFGQINMYASSPITLYINGSDDVGWTMTTQIVQQIPWREGSNAKQLMSSLYNMGGGKIDFGLSNTYYSTTGITSYNSGSLTTMFNWLNLHFRHSSIMVNGVSWSVVNTPNYPIVIPDQLTIWDNQPLQYEFPSDTYLKLPDLTNIITNAINNSGVVMWSDIADCFVDVNGQTAVAVTKIVRNDYDNLYMEQYPYPAMLVGMTDQTKFNEHLLDDSHAYLSPMGTVVQETVNVLPSELVGVLAIGAILTIFAVIINRLLE